MDRNTHKELFSYAYVNAIASAAGYTMELRPRSVDAGGIDLTVTATEEVGQIRFPCFDAQAKCTDETRGHGDPLRYALKVKNYDDLRAENVLTPRILIVVYVPDDASDWLHQTEDELCMRYCGYWASLRGQPATENTATKTISIPRGQVFDVDAARTVMQRIAAGQDL